MNTHSRLQHGRRVGFRALLSTFIGVVVFGALAGTASAANSWTVCSFACTYTTIEDAVNSPMTHDGDTILVGSGSYAVSGANINKSLTLSGAKAGVDARGPGRGTSESIITTGNLGVFTLAAANVTFDGFTFSNLMNRTIDTSVNADNFTMRNCILSGNGDGAIQFGGPDTVHANGLVLEQNLVMVDNGPFLNMLHSMDNGTIRNNVFHGDVMSYGPFGDRTGWLIEGNDFSGSPGHGHYYGTGFITANLGDVTIRNNTFTKMVGGLGTISVVGGSIYGNTFDDNEFYAFALWGGENGSIVSRNVSIHNNLIKYNGEDYPADIASHLSQGIHLRPDCTAPGGGGGPCATPTPDASNIHINVNRFVDLNPSGGKTQVWAIRQNMPNTVDAELNYWGTIVPSEVAAKIGKASMVVFDAGSGLGDTDPFITSYTDDPAKAGQPGFWPLYYRDAGLGLDPLSNITYGGTQVNAHAFSNSSGLITYGTTSPGVCSVAPSTGAITINSAGNCTVTAHQDANGAYAADDASTSFMINRANQAPLTLHTTTPLPDNTSETLSVTGGTTSGTVTYNLLSGPCTIVGNQLTANSGSGSCTLTATMAGSTNYNDVTSTPANTVNLVPGPVNAGTSTVVAAPTSVPADNSTTSTITVTLKDALNNPVSGKTVALAAGSGSSTIATVNGTTNASGQATFTVKDAVAESVTYTATDTTDSVTVTPTATVTFTALGPSAVFITADSSTQGNWKGVYGSQGAAIVNDSLNYPSYAPTTVSPNVTWTWAASTADGRALQRAATGRIAACWCASTFDINIDLTDGSSHQVALYALDWDNQPRSERVDVLIFGTNTVLDTRTLTGFNGGRYLVWRLSGHVTIRVTLLSGPNAVVSGLFFDTPGGPGPSAPTAVTSAATGISTTGATLNSTVNPNGLATTAFFQYGPTAALVSTTSPASNLGAGSSAMPVSFPVTGLSCNTTYFFRVVGQSSAGSSNGSTLQFTTLACAGPLAPTVVTGAATGTSTTGTTLNGTVNPNSVASTAFFEWGPTAGLGNTTSPVTNVGSGSSAVPVTAPLTGLTCNTTYFYRVVGQSSAGTSNGSTLQVTTSACVGGGPSAVFVRTDASTQGNWKGVYGSQGATIANDSTNYPAYAPTSVSTGVTWTWTASTTDGRALQRAATGRIAACWCASTFNIDVNITDGQPHQLALYGIDWDNNGRSERIDVLAFGTTTVLDTRTLTGFSGGQYLVWTLSGHVTIRVTLTAGANAVVSGLFFDTAAPAGPSAPTVVTGAATVPTMTSATLNGTVNPNGLAATGSFQYGTTVAYLGGTTTPVNVGAGSSPVAVATPISGLTCGTTYHFRIVGQSSAGTSNGLDAQFATAACPGGPSAVFVRNDAATQGNWKTVYGSQGAALINDALNYPAYAQVTPSTNVTWTWASSTTDVRALLRNALNAGRIAACWCNSTFTFDVNITDGQTHQIAFYAVDWDNRGRTERVDVNAFGTNTLLDTRTLTSFTNGQYLVWNVSGHVTITITLTGGPNAVISALFFDPVGGPPALTGMAVPGLLENEKFTSAP